MEKRPNVFQDKSSEPEATNVPEKSYDELKGEVTEQIYSTSTNENFSSAAEEMRQRTAEQLKRSALGEQIRRRDLALEQNRKDTAKYQENYTKAETRTPTEPKVEPKPTMMASKPKPVMPKELAPEMNQEQLFIQQISQPNFNQPFDVLPLPSEGKLYRVKKPSIKLAYMTAADENILTSPNILRSSEFLEILINRKMLDTNLRYNDLLKGDRDAIMVWLRATSYGEDYSITVLDENDIPFDTSVNLSQLEVKKLGAEPDDEGYFDFTLPVSKTHIKFKLLTVGELAKIQELIDADIKNMVMVNYTNTYLLSRHIVEVDGTRDEAYINDFVDSMRIGDSKALKDYIVKIESGIDLDLTLETPGGGSVKTFFPINISFFWPNVGL